MHALFRTRTLQLAPPLLARPAGVVVALAHAQLVVLRSAALRLVPILALLTETNRATQSAKHENVEFRKKRRHGVWSHLRSSSPANPSSLSSSSASLKSSSELD